MKLSFIHIVVLFTGLFFLTGMQLAFAQTEKGMQNLKKASRKVESGFKKENADTLAQGYYELGESFMQKGDLKKSEQYFSRARVLFEQQSDQEGIARSSRALARVQEDQHKNKEAIGNYKRALDVKPNDKEGSFNTLNQNDIRRLTWADSTPVQESLIQQNIKVGLVNKDTAEIVSNFSRMADLGLKNNNSVQALDAYTNAYKYSRAIPEQAVQFNQKIADVYIQSKNFPKAIETKEELLKEDFILQSTRLKAREIVSLAGIYLLKSEDSMAVNLLNQSYDLSVSNGHTMEAKAALKKLDSIFRSNGQQELSLMLYQDFLEKLPDILSKDSSIADNRIVAETENRVKELEYEKALKDDLIRRKNIFNYWLIGSIIILLGSLVFILIIIRKLRTKNRKIALQSLRREMNPHFIFNSLNSINQFIAHNNELEANRYLTRFSTLMRRVMENSAHDFVLLSREYELLQHYLELEKSRFPDKFDFAIKVDDSLLADEQLYIPGMLIQPHLENAIWHGLRYIERKGKLELTFTRTAKGIDVLIEDNGIGIAASESYKTENQKKRNGRGIRNTLERIRILNELYRQHIVCTVEDKLPPETGVVVRMSVPVMKNNSA